MIKEYYEFSKGETWADYDNQTKEAQLEINSIKI